MDPEKLYPSVVLVLPQSTTKGEVAVTSAATQLVVGDVILFNPTPEVNITKNGITYRVVQESNVLGWFTKMQRFNVE